MDNVWKLKRGLVEPVFLSGSLINKFYFIALYLKACEGDFNIIIGFYIFNYLYYVGKNYEVP